MSETINFNSLPEFPGQLHEHVERLKHSRKAEVLTIDGKAELIVQDAESYQELVKKAEFADTVKAIRTGMKSHEQGEAKPMRKALEDIAASVGFNLDE